MPETHDAVIGQLDARHASKQGNGGVGAVPPSARRDITSVEAIRPDSERADPWKINISVKACLENGIDLCKVGRKRVASNVLHTSITKMRGVKHHRPEQPVVDSATNDEDGSPACTIRPSGAIRVDVKVTSTMVWEMIAKTNGGDRLLSDWRSDSGGTPTILWAKYRRILENERTKSGNFRGKLRI